MQFLDVSASKRLGIYKFTGRSAVRLARLVRDQEVGGSNPLAPIATDLADLQRIDADLYGDAEHSALIRY